MSNLNIIYGLKPIKEAMQSGYSINRIYVAKESRASGCSAILDEAKSKSIPFDFVPQAKVNELTRTMEHQGIAAKVSPIEYTDLKSFINFCPDITTILILDQVHHPKNLGMIIRTAVASGTAAIILTARKGALIDDSVVRASTGAVFNIPIIKSNNLSQTIKQLKDAHFWVYGLDAKGTTDIFTLDWPTKTALIIGNETKGMRPVIEKSCDDLVNIPLHNNMDSLNASVAAGVALFQANRSTLQKNDHTKYGHG
jgi:23S rRNA (guanosine2251-2'-O)-methyltransferase